MFRHIEVYLDADDTALIKWLAERDGETFKEEMRQIFWTELDQLRTLYFEEMKQETGYKEEDDIYNYRTNLTAKDVRNMS